MKKKAASAGMPAYLRLLLTGGALGALAIATPAYAADTKAGTKAGVKITNQAVASYEGPDPEVPVEVESNEVAITVDEIIDVNVSWTDNPKNVIVDTPSEKQVLKFTVTNAGNGPEAFDLSYDTTTGGDFEPDVVNIYLDTNENGTYEEGTDALYDSGVPTIDADDSITVFVVSGIPDSLSAGDLGHVDLQAVSQTGPGGEGTVYDGAGEGDEEGDAVIGAISDSDSARGTYEVDGDTPPPTPLSVDLDKSYEVEDDEGREVAVPGSTITYTLEATVAGDGTVNNLRIDDAIPEDTTYVEESLTLDGDELSDAGDGDEGEYTGTGISVDLGNVTSPATHTITFQVTIDE